MVGWDDSGRFAFLVCLCLWICGCIMDKLMYDIYILFFVGGGKVYYNKSNCER